MTNPVILLGTQSNGETLPVQVDAFGRLVAEGLAGEPGSDGAAGPPGPPGADGGSFPLPPNPYEGALLGWLNNELTWVSGGAVPIPPGVFGPITDWDPSSGLITVEGELPEGVGNGVYIKQVSSNGELYTAGCNVSQKWSYGQANSYWYADRGKIFDGDLTTFTGPNTGRTCELTFPEPFVGTRVEYLTQHGARSGIVYKLIIDGKTVDKTTDVDSDSWLTIQTSPSGLISKIAIQSTGESGGRIGAISVDGQLLLDEDKSSEIRVTQALNSTQFIGAANNDIGFEVGKYLKIEEQRVAPWVLYGNDPTSLIDHLRSKRD